MSNVGSLFSRHRLITACAALIGGLLLVQLFPYGHQHSNPPVGVELGWDSPTTRLLAQRACFACHSNQTSWPWYSNVAPVSWLVQRDVDNGRQRLNFQDWNRTRSTRNLQEIAEVVTSGEMPPAYYTWLHGEAKLTAAEKQQLADGLTATLKQAQSAGR